VSSLAAGAGTNYTITAYATTVTSFTNVAYSTAATYDPNPANNNGASTNSQCLTTVTQVILEPVNKLYVVSTATNFNPQSGLYEELVIVTNVGTAPASAVRLTVSGLPSFVSLYSATGTNAGIPYVQNNFPLLPGAQMDFILEFYDSLLKPFTNYVTAVAVQPVAAPAIPTNAVPVAVTSIFKDAVTIEGIPRFVVQFPTTPGDTYAVIYTDTLSPGVWYVVTPYVNATANVFQWYDDGPPKTKSQPSTINSRFYRVVRVK
jgi:hypothetical protein